MNAHETGKYFFHEVAKMEKGQKVAKVAKTAEEKAEDYASNKEFFFRALGVVGTFLVIVLFIGLLFYGHTIWPR